MEEVAARAGVSKATVSRVLNSNGTVVEKTRHRVLAACRDLNYRLNPNIQDLVLKSKNGSTRNLAFVLVGNEFSNPSYVRLLDGISEGANRHRYHLMLVKLSGRESDLYDLPAILRDERIDGILLSGDLNQTVSELFANLRIPCVILGNYEMELLGALSSVQWNYPAAMNRFVGELKEGGSRRIAFTIEDINLYCHRCIFDAFQAALKLHGLEWDPSLAFFGGGPMSGVFELLKPLFASPRELPFDTIFCPDYREAVELSHLILARTGLRDRGSVLLGATRPYDYYRLPAPARFIIFDMAELAREGLNLLVKQISENAHGQKTLFI